MEYALVGGRRVVIDTSMIIGVDMPVNKLTGGTTDNPVMLLLRNGERLPLIAVEPVMVLARMNMVEAKADELKETGKDIPIVVDWLERDDGE